MANVVANNMSCKVGSGGQGGSHPSSLLISHMENRSLESLEVRSKGVDIEGSDVHDSDLDCLMSSAVGSSIVLDGSMKDLSESCCSSASGRCCPGYVSKTEEDDGCLDDWEAVADALTFNEKQNNPNLEPLSGFGKKIGLTEPSNSGVSLSERESKEVISRGQVNRRAWQPDDVYRPRSLPSVKKHCSFTTDSSNGSVSWACQSIMTQPSSCLICCEDFDLTDLSFLPCPRGFRICLFCHKRILETDGLCPCRRKNYDP
ncbi:unnamed protein product [Ilex paraguariensis]|uniref:RING-type domain-containing protein n=1 Tax=Ilex paraguariensis TaxID=185542 RepID=A0ABC8R304_9AQUA